MSKFPSVFFSDLIMSGTVISHVDSSEVTVCQSSLKVKFYRI